MDIHDLYLCTVFTMITRHGKISGYQKLTALSFVPTKVRSYGVFCCLRTAKDSPGSEVFCEQCWVPWSESRYHFLVQGMEKTLEHVLIFYPQISSFSLWKSGFSLWKWLLLLTFCILHILIWAFRKPSAKQKRLPKGVVVQNSHSLLLDAIVLFHFLHVLH